VHWLNTFHIDSIDNFTTFVSSIIFTASAQHAAVNFPQEQLESYAPAYPLGLYHPPPATREQSTSKTDYLAMLPPLEMATTQKAVGYLLGGVYHTQLGHYDPAHFTHPDVLVALSNFQRALQLVGDEIGRRNMKRVTAWSGHMTEEMANHWSYKYLLPERIPQSINI